MPNRVWLADMAYIPTDEGWLYLAVVPDLTTRVVGWAGEPMETGTPAWMASASGSTSAAYRGETSHAAAVRKMMVFINPNGEVGTISVAGSTTTYATSSDYRLKENEETLGGALDRLRRLKPYRFNFKPNPGVRLDGFYAHEVADVVPEAVLGEKDEVRQIGDLHENSRLVARDVPQPDPDELEGREWVKTDEQLSYQSLYHSKLVPLLVAAVQELSRKVEELKALRAEN